jgi:type III secretion protein O
MNKMLKELIKIKTFRRNKAETEMAVQRKNVENATAAVKAAEEELTRYMIESTQQEKRLFQNILNQKVKLQKIEEMQQKISLLRDGVVTREENKRDAHAELNVYQTRLHQAQENYQLMLRIEEKFLLLGRIDDETALREAERLSDLELEEVPLTPHHIDEWEYHDE